MLNNLSSGNNSNTNSAQIQINKINKEITEIKEDIIDSSERLDCVDQRFTNLSNVVNTNKVFADVINSDEVSADTVSANVVGVGRIESNEDVLVISSENTVSIDSNVETNDLTVKGNLLLQNEVCNGTFIDANLAGNTRISNAEIANETVNNAAIETAEIENANVETLTVDTETVSTLNADTANVEVIENATFNGNAINADTIDTREFSATDVVSTDRFVANCSEIGKTFKGNTLSRFRLPVPAVSVLSDYVVLHIPIKVLSKNVNDYYSNEGRLTLYSSFESPTKGVCQWAIHIDITGHVIDIKYSQSTLDLIKWFATNEETKELLIAVRPERSSIYVGADSTNYEYFGLYSKEITAVLNERQPAGPLDQVYEISDRLDEEVIMFDGTSSQGLYVNGCLNAKYIDLGSGAIFDALSINCNLQVGSAISGGGVSTIYDTLIVCCPDAGKTEIKGKTITTNIIDVNTVKVNEIYPLTNNSSKIVWQRVNNNNNIILDCVKELEANGTDKVSLKDYTINNTGIIPNTNNATCLGSATNYFSNTYTCAISTQSIVVTDKLTTKDLLVQNKADIKDLTVSGCFNANNVNGWCILPASITGTGSIGTQTNRLPVYTNCINNVWAITDSVLTNNNATITVDTVVVNTDIQTPKISTNCINSTDIVNVNNDIYVNDYKVLTANDVKAYSTGNVPLLAATNDEFVCNSKITLGTDKVSISGKGAGYYLSTECNNAAFITNNSSSSAYGYGIEDMNTNRFVIWSGNDAGNTHIRASKTTGCIILNEATCACCGLKVGSGALIKCITWSGNTLSFCI